MSAAFESDPGLCRDCLHSRRIESDRGSVFWQCQRSFTDPRFRKYPGLPVRECVGYERATETDSDLGEASRR